MKGYFTYSIVRTALKSGKKHSLISKKGGKPFIHPSVKILKMSGAEV